MDETDTPLKRAIPHVHRLLEILRSQTLPEDSADKVLCRSADCSQSSVDLFRAQHARRRGKEINAGCGLNSVRHLPYKPFGVFHILKSILS
jgi:hypothetical protein